MEPDNEEKPPELLPGAEPTESQPAGRPEAPEQEATPNQRPSPDEALAEMRRSLREDQPPPEKGFRATVKRVTRALFRNKTETVKPAPEEAEAQSELPQLSAPTAVKRVTDRLLRRKTGPLKAAPEEADAPSERAPVLDKRIVPFADTPTEPQEAKAPTQETGPEPAERRLFLPGMDSDWGVYTRTRYSDDIKTEEPARAGPPQSILSTIREPGEGTEEDATTLRQEALQDYVLKPEEPQGERGPSSLQSLRRDWRYLRSAEKRLLIMAVILLGLATLAGGSFLVVKSLPTPVVTITPTFSARPVPISVSLPGGWVFPLRTGSVEKNGKWNPVGAEWLRGTEICRWVSLPWTVQLEVVIRTLKPHDEIKLSMSNYDSLTYKVDSIKQIPSSQISDLATNTPSLLLILAKSGSDSRWVVSARP